MESTLSIPSLMAFAGVMLVGALIPGVSVLTVSVRSLAFGFQHGVAAATGIVMGDLLFILVAIYGLSILIEWMGGYLFLFQYLGGAYLIGLGLILWWPKPTPVQAPARRGGSLSASFVLGLAVTLADQKAILFYLAFFPTFLDLTAVSAVDTASILLVAILAVGIPKLVYAYLAGSAVLVMENPRATRFINRIAGAALISIGIYLVGAA